jgi:hypothetical protein
MGIYNQCYLNSYANALQHINGARNPAKGRAVKSWARLFKDNETQVVYLVPKWDYTTRLAEFHPDNTLHMIMTPQYVGRNACTIVGSIQRALPVSLLRVGSQRYRIESNNLMHKIYFESNNTSDYSGYRTSYYHLKKEAPEYFSGLILDLKTNTWVNKKPDRLSNVDTKVRAEWLSKLRIYKRGIKLRAKMGVFDALVNTEVAMHGHNNRWQRPDPKLETKMKDIADAIRNEAYPTELLKDFVLHAHKSNWEKLSTTIVVYEIENYFKQQSINIREAFGVFVV